MSCGRIFRSSERVLIDTVAGPFASEAREERWSSLCLSTLIEFRLCWPVLWACLIIRVTHGVLKVSARASESGLVNSESVRKMGTEFVRGFSHKSLR